MILATDLDGTFLGGTPQQQEQLYKLLHNNQHISLIFVTGRGLESVKQLLQDPKIPKPAYIICDVGATIVEAHNLQPVQPIQAAIESKWPGADAIVSSFKNIEGMRLQDVPHERRCAFVYDHPEALEQMEAIMLPPSVHKIVSHGCYIDVLPADVSKGSTLAALCALKNLEEERILVAGDTLNDLSMYGIGFKGVVVDAANSELRTATANLEDVYHAQNAGAGGILEAMQYFDEFSEWGVKAKSNLAHF
jgi:HAD superfamily hydrolase (TIGR01484 family)